MTDYYCPHCDGVLAFVGSVGITVHECGETQADRYDCEQGHSVLVVSQVAFDDRYCSECRQIADHAETCSYHERCPHCGEDAAERIGDTAIGVPIRSCSACGAEWEHSRR